MKTVTLFAIIGTALGLVAQLAWLLFPLLRDAGQNAVVVFQTVTGILHIITTISWIVFLSVLFSKQK